MGVFENCSMLLELKNVVFKEKKQLKSAVTQNGGHICFVVTKQVRGGDVLRFNEYLHVCLQTYQSG